VSQSGIVTHALEKFALNYFEAVRCLTSIEEIESMDSNTRAILFDLTTASSDVKSLLNLEIAFKGCLNKVAVLVRENLDFRDIEDLLGKVGAIIPHTVDTEDIIRLVNCLRNGIFIIPSKFLHSMISSNSNHSALKSTDVLDLTPRQKAVLSMLAEGQSNKLIARSLGINDTTVRVHVRAVLRKLGVTNRTQAALVASKHLNS
jgi:two-component system, NarL family, nitrate/nitrite response regulator NarL